MSYSVAFMETFSISAFPYYTFENRGMAYTLGALPQQKEAVNDYASSMLHPASASALNFGFWYRLIVLHCTYIDGSLIHML